MMRVKGLVVGGVLSTAVVTGGWLLQRGLHEAPNRVNGARLFDQVAAQIKRNYVDSLSDNELYEKAMVGMLHELHDPHTLYLQPDRLQRLTESTSGNYAGIGVQIDLRDRWPTVLGAIPGTPADEAGLRSGDRVVEIDGKSTRGWTIDETRNAIRGTPGTKVRLTVERPGQAEPIALTVLRGEIHRQAVGRAALVRDGVGYIDLDIFSDSTELELVRAIDSLRTAGMKSLVLDLRSNPGGLLSQGVEVADLFLDPRDLIVSMRGRIPDANSRVFDSAPQRWPELPVLILIDEGSASASEIVAGALQDHDRALIAGRTSFGKGSAQSLFPIETGGAVKITVARWYTPAGRSIDRVRPDDNGSDAAEEQSRKEYRTEQGRVVYGGGGITPDMVTGDTALAPAEQALITALGDRVTEFRDALTAYAIRAKTERMVTSPDFPATDRMLDDLWQSLRARGFTFDRSVYDGARDLVARLLAREITRYVFGPAAAALRSIHDDEVIQNAVATAAGARTQSELLKRIPAASRER